ncbi:MAG: transglycosylase SLT domain-containing protein [Burkholderiaceae bacterium]
MTATGRIVSGLRNTAARVMSGFLELTHNGFALLGLAVAFVALTLVARPDLRESGEALLREWLRDRHVATAGLPVEPDAIERATAANPQDLPREQASLAFWLSRKYRVAPEPLSAIVAEAYEIGRTMKLDPTLILAVMAIESNFNPFAQSAVGAQGLMQVMTRVHTDKYQYFGGHMAAFDPVSNLRVGAKVLQECIARAGSVEGGLRFYVGAAHLPDDGGYVAKVLAEHGRLQQVAAGRNVPLQPAVTVPAPTPTAAAAPASAAAAPQSAQAPAAQKLALLESAASPSTP